MVLPHGLTRWSWSNVFTIIPHFFAAYSSITRCGESKQRECICIHIGQGGIQSGLAVWELLSTEHAVLHDGHLDTTREDAKKKMDDYPGTLSVFFQERAHDFYIPRAVMVDFGPDILDYVRWGFYNFYDPDKLISGKEEAINFARGYYTVGRLFLEPTMNQIRKSLNECENLQGIFVFHSYGGGTGSGFSSLLMDTLSEEMSKKTRLEYGIYSAYDIPTIQTVLEPYNSILATDKSVEVFDCSFPLDNQSLYNICQKKLLIDTPTYPDMNRVVAEVVSATSSPFRFRNPLNVYLDDFQVNLFPFPKAHFPVVGLAPISRHSKGFHEPASVNSITLDALDSLSQVIECDLSKGVYMACILLYRGDICPKDINATIDSLKNKKKLFNFSDCCPTGFKVGLNNQPMMSPAYWDMHNSSKSVCMISNNTAISSAWMRINYKFDQLFGRKAYLHWFLAEGMEEQQFIEARTNLESLTMEYVDFQNDSASRASKSVERKPGSKRIPQEN